MFGGGVFIDSARRTKWSRAWRRCFPGVWHEIHVLHIREGIRAPIVDPGRNFECTVSCSSDVR